MNRIEVIRASSKHVPEPHLGIAGDGVPLDVALGVEGLVSSLLGWFHHEPDAAVPWERILPDVGCSGYAPVLICPDDLDLCCSVVMAEVVAEAEVIRWDRLGYSAAAGLCRGVGPMGGGLGAVPLQPRRVRAVFSSLQAPRRRPRNFFF